MTSFLAIEPLTVMLSSRCADLVSFDGHEQPMGVVREAIKAELEALRCGDEQIFKVWIHEHESVVAGDRTSWDQCMSRARSADIFLMLYNGNAGWAGSMDEVADEVGICHAELAVAYNRSPGKVRSIQFPVAEYGWSGPDLRFQEYVLRHKIIGAQVSTGRQAVAQAVRAAVSALLSLARAGVGVVRGGSFFTGEALEWTRLDYGQRRAVTTATVVGFLSERFGERAAVVGRQTVVLPLAQARVAFVCDCIPATLTTAAARELVGRPFLRDHLWCAELPPRAGGPVHLIACQKGVTEAQALRQLGFPDAIAVSAPFGVYVADDVQKIQMALIANCRDQTTTRLQVQRFLQWLEEQGEDRLLAERAAARRRIADLIAKEQQR